MACSVRISTGSSCSKTRRGCTWPPTPRSLTGRPSKRRPRRWSPRRLRPAVRIGGSNEAGRVERGAAWADPIAGSAEADRVAAEADITRLLHRYAHAVDRGDLEAVRACYWD